MNEQERNEMLELLHALKNSMDDLKNDDDATLDGAVSINIDGELCIEGHDGFGNCGALRITVADDDSYSVTLEGGFRKGKRFETNIFLGNIKDVVEAAVVLSQAGWDYCGIDKELIKGAIRQGWRDPIEIRAFITDQMIAHSAEME